MLAPITTADKPRKRRAPLDDAAFLDALDFVEFRTASAIARRMLAAGHPARLATITATMSEYVRETDAIEAKGASWRIAPDVTPLSPANDNRRTLALDTLHVGDCLELMASIPDQSVHLIIGDLPYGTCGGRYEGRNIDIPIDLEAFWREARRIVTPTGNVLMFASQPFTTDVINSNREWFKYAMVWRKDKPSGFNHARNKPMKDHEDILLFSPGYNIHARKPGGRRAGTSDQRATYNPWRAVEVEKTNNPKRCPNIRYTRDTKVYPGRHRYAGLKDCPRTVLEYAKQRKGIHPYQKPVALLDDLIRMFSNPGEVVFDPTAGSCSSAVAAHRAGRDWLMIEQDEGVARAAQKWLDEVLATEAAR